MTRQGARAKWGFKRVGILELEADRRAINITVNSIDTDLDLKQRETETTDEWKTRGVLLCYHVLGLVQYLPGCQPVPSQVKDYISFPKPNGYQSLHTTIMRDGQVVEVQIRTGWMHSVAEFGMAAHWAYKDPAGVEDAPIRVAVRDSV